MIPRTTIELAVPTAQYYQAKGLAVVAKPDTVLSAIIGTNIPLVQCRPPAGTPVEESAYLDLAYEEQKTDGGSIDTHGVAIDEVTTKLSAYVKQHMSHAKNVVVPAITQYATLMQAFKESYTPKPATAEYNIVQLDVPSPLRDEVVLSSLETYRANMYPTPAVSLRLGTKTRGELLDIIMIGERDTDALIAGWFNQLTDADVMGVWLGFFAVDAVQVGIVPFTVTGLITKNEFQKSNIALLTYLLANGTYNKVQDSSHSLTAYKTAAGDLRNWAGSVMMNSLNQIDGYAKNKIMVVEMTPINKTITVYGDCYRAWLASGGKPETLLGLLVSGKRLTTTTSIDTELATLEKAWLSYKSYHENREFNQSIVYFKSALETNFNLIMSGVNEDERNIVGTDFFINANKYFKEELNKITTDDISDVYGVCMRLLCRARYYYTESEKILLGIEKASRNNPGLSPQEAAFASMTDYVTDYVCDQLYLTSNV